MTEPAFTLLGTPTFHAGGTAVTLPDTMPARLVAVLALRQAAVSRSELAGLLYPDEPESVARQRLRLQLSRARKLHPDLPLRASDHYASCIAVTDVHRLLRDADEQNWAAVASQPAPRLLGSWELQGDLLSSLEPLQNQLTEAWLLAIRRNARDLLAKAEHEQAFAQLSRALAEEPLAEDILQLLLQVGPAAGRRREALEAYARFMEESEPLQPLPTTVALKRQLAGSSAGALPDPGLVRRATATLGQLATPATVADMVNAPLEAVTEVLGQLERSGELDEHGQLMDPGAVLAELTAVEKRWLHSLAARALSHTGQPLAEGEHWLLAGDSERAVAAWFPATTNLFSRQIGRQDEALELYERILALPVRSPAWYAASAYYAAQQLILQGREPALARVEEVLLESDEPLARTFALLVKADIELSEGQLEAAADSLRLAELHARQTDSQALHRDVKLSRVRMLSAHGRLREALALTEGMLEQLSLEPPRLAKLTWLGAHALILCDLGEFETALKSYHQQLELARLLGFPREQVRVTADILATLADMGRAGEQVELGFEALRLGEFDVSWPLRYSLAEGLIALGRPGEAREQLEAILAAEGATASTRGYALALRLALPEADEQLIERASSFARQSELPNVRVAIAAALDRLGATVPDELIRELIRDVQPAQLPAWLAEDWQQLRRHQLIRS